MDRGCEAALVMVCDQPHATVEVLNKLVEVYKEGAVNIVAAYYDGKPGTPALFGKTVFDQLLQLKGDKGAKQMILDHAAVAVFVDFPAGVTDIDTPGDYEKLIKEKGQDDQG
jgi:molybdenum cofactor cytidylyltransferase